MTLVAATIASMFGKYVTLEREVEQRPIVVIATEVDASSASSIATVWATIRVVLHVAQVHTAASALARATTDFYIVNEIGFCHNYNR